MNFQDLFNKIKAIDEGAMSAPAPALAVASGDEVLTGECGGDMPGDMMRPPMPKQSDSVTMNVSINGSGAGGIRDLMDVLKDIQNGPGHDEHDSMPAAPEIDLAFGEEQTDGGFTSATTSPEQHIGGVEMVTPTGNDLSSKGGNEVEKVNGGGNPYNTVQEALVSRLQAHYESIKGTDVEEGMWDTIKQGAQSAVQGVQNAANTVANTTVGDLATKYNPGVQLAKGVANAAQNVGNQVKQAGQGIVNANKAAYGAIGNAAQAVGQKVAGAVAPAKAMAPVKPADGFSDQVDAFGNPIVTQKTASAPPQQFGFESVEMTDIRKLAGL